MRRLSLLFVLVIVVAVIFVRAGERKQAATQSTGESTETLKSGRPLILQEDDGERRVRRPGGPVPVSGDGSIPEFFIKIDKLNGNAQDFFVATEILVPGAIVPFHKHLNAEEVVILEEGGATVIVGDKRAVAGPHSIVFIPRDTWVSVTNTGNAPIHFYGLFSRPGFDECMRARSVHPGESRKTLTPEEIEQSSRHGHAMFWDVSKGPYPPGVAHP